MPQNFPLLPTASIASHSREHGSAKRPGAFTCCSFIAAVLFATGCSTTLVDGSRTTAEAPALRTASLQQRLIKGMRRSEVENYLGPASEVTPFVNAGAAGEIWVYTNVVPGPSRQVAAAMKDVEFVDPVTGEMRMIQEPVFKNEITTITEITELLFIKDLLVEWKLKRFADRHLD